MRKIVKNILKQWVKLQSSSNYNYLVSKTKVSKKTSVQALLYNDTRGTPKKVFDVSIVNSYLF